MTTVAELLKEAVNKFKSAGIETPQLDAEVILCNIMNFERIQLHIYPEREISQEICRKFWELVEKRLNRMPIQYIINRQEFMGLDFFVEEGVLIPRGDTEILVEEVIRLYGEFFKGTNGTILDIGTGSGAITVTLAILIKNSIVFSIDISHKALAIAKKNAKNHGVDHKINFLQGNLLDPLLNKGFEKTFHFIVSNPPYIPTETVKGLSSQVKDYEPELALDGGEDGLDFYRKIVNESPKYLINKGWLVFEIGYDQGEAVSRLMDEAGFSKVEIIKDLAGLDRVVKGEWVK
ncbi:peptide chain release factor N(5)-glutamine methyltransferase [Alkaliphilus peptidifermentans]|uniref:Release factor glutamine methyltransferase n=2 Tax=Alkaliphilus peptidifermentans DSM 18978 TaxID=1120976 RepID=A0A1G5AAD7_9FIRM|nr:peptide chain release factor N(5)-glutamine methyltransferase [Alkaliphilus peptidifermentans]SCX74846.1 release factor glutamine methyltransferase [Alkaliphilus peptidifermentans DSM 18978]